MMLRTVHAVLAVLLGIVQGYAHGEPGLAAHWDFSEGQGDVLHDRSGNNNHGRIRGARWVAIGETYALEFDGIDDCVDCGAGASLDLRNRLSLEAWVYVEPPLTSGEPGIIGKSYGSYAITAWAGLLWSYVSAGGKNVNCPVSMAEWHHVASTYDGKHIRIYLDGVLANEKAFEVQAAEGKNFWMGRSDGDILFTKDARFRGRLTGVRVYNRPLSADEVARRAQRLSRADTFIVSAVPVPWQRKLFVQLDKRGLPRRREMTGHVELLAVGPDSKPVGAVLASATAAVFTPYGKADIVLFVPDLAPGRYQVRAVARDRAGEPIGAVAIEPVEWPSYESFPRGPKGAGRLNNLVTELLNVPGPDASGKPRPFVNPRKGWVFISNRGAVRVIIKAKNATDVMHVPLDKTHAQARETMRLLPKGEYTVAATVIRDLIVRAVPRLVYANHRAECLVPQFRSYREEFEKRYILKNVNTFAGGSSELAAQLAQDPTFRWVVQCSVPKDKPNKPLTVEAAYNFITGHPAFVQPSFNGLIADEFGSSQPYCAIYARALDKALAEPEFRGKLYWPYAGNLWNGPEGRQLVKRLVKYDCAIAWKRYLKEQRTEVGAWRFLKYVLTGPARRLIQECPGALPHLIPCFGHFSVPRERLDTFPHVNHRTWLDMQFNLVANDPAFDGCGGLMTYLSSFADRETLRWGLRLFRHYGIEGRTEMLGRDPYILTHLQNGDFEFAGAHWNLQPAERDSIRFGKYIRYGWLQGRYPETIEGDTVLITRRRAKRPNLFSQDIKNLDPGRLYTFRMYTGDYKDMSQKQKHAVSIKIENVQFIPEKCFTHVYPNCHTHARYDRDKAWMNFHWRVFRAKGKTARLTISDWTSEKEPGGPVGQELMYNFVQVQPYCAPEEE